MVQKWYTFSRKCPSEFEFWSFPQTSNRGYSLVMLGSSQSAPRPQGWTTDTLQGTIFCSDFSDISEGCRHPIMSTECPSVSPASNEKRKASPLKMKLKITAQQEGSKPVTATAYESGLWQSTISKDKTQMSDAVKSAALLQVTVMTRRAGPIGDMEKLLVTWMEDQIRMFIPLRYWNPG